MSLRRDHEVARRDAAALTRPLSYGRQCLDDDDRRAVLDALESDWLTQGPYAERFESALAEQFGVRHAVVCSSGTSALHLAAIALGWGPGDVIIVPAITFIASANCALYVGAEPYFVDVDPVTATIDPNEVERAVKRLQQAGRKVRAVVGVDLGGHPADWLALRCIADRHGLDLVDDACHAMGATYADTFAIGSCAHPDIATLSFHPVKHITSAEGGAVLTNDSRVADAAALIRSHGIQRGRANVAGWEGPWHLDMTHLGYNFRLSDIQCALGVSQLRKLGAFVAKRREIAGWYHELLSRDGVFGQPAQTAGTSHAYHLYVLRAKFRAGPSGRREFFARCEEQALRLQVHYRPIPLNSFYVERWPRDALERLPHSMRYYEQCFSIPMYPALTRDDVNFVSEVIRAHISESLESP